MEADNTQQQDDDGFESFVKEAPVMIELVNRLVDPQNNQPLVEIDQKLESMLDKYMEQPTLLDPHLRELVLPLMGCVRADHPRLHRACSAVYHFCRVRGHKTIIKFFPHAVSDLEPTFELLMQTRAQQKKQQQLAQPENTAVVAGKSIQKNPNPLWHTEYTLLVWVSMLVLVPFDLVTVDSSVQHGQQGQHSQLIENIIELCKGYLSATGIDKEGAALVLGRLLTRPDMSSQLQSFLHWAKQTLMANADEQTQQSTGSLHERELITAGTLMALARIFKHGKRDEVLQHTGGLVDFVISLQGRAQTDAISGKLCVKVVQRICLLQLPPRVASWRYERGMRHLTQNITAPTHQPKAEETNTHEEDDDDMDLPENLEEVLDFLFKSLKSRDTLTRWSAAKGIGRITSRIPRNFADEVVSGVLDSVNEIEASDGAWHGACLAIGEMARRGVLLPARLPHAIPFVSKALSFERRKGSFSVGAHVRDAACYVCWAFGRAYAPAVLRPYVVTMSQGLLITACYDREVNCRRAASAAFQENVGRQGTFPHGIDILSKADYFALGNRAHAYLDVSLFVAQFEEYKEALIDHIVQIKLNNWDKAIRELASKTLYRLALAHPDLVANRLTVLLPRVSAMEPLEREGAILGIGEIILGVYSAGHSLESKPEVLSQVQQIVSVIQKKRLFRGKGGEYVRAALSRFVECISLTGMPYPDDLVKLTVAMLEENIKNPQEYIQQSAVLAFGALAKRFFAHDADAFTSGLCLRYVHSSCDPLVNVSRGFSSTVGVLTAQMLRPHIGLAITNLSKAMEISANADSRDAETRRNATTAIVDAAITFASLYPAELTKEMVQTVTGSVLLALSDFCVDNRGDVGSWVRIVALQAMAKWLEFLVEKHVGDNPFILPQITCTRVIAAILRQVTGRLERVRGVALTALAKILALAAPLPAHIPHHKLLFEQFVEADSRSSEKRASWGLEKTLTACSPLVATDAYRQSVLEGWCTCTEQMNGFRQASFAVMQLARAGWLEPYTTEETPGVTPRNTTGTVVLAELVRMMHPRPAPPVGADPNPTKLVLSAVVCVAKLFEALTLSTVESKPAICIPRAFLEAPPTTTNEGVALESWGWVFNSHPALHFDGIAACKPSGEGAWEAAAEISVDDVIGALVAALETKLTSKEFGVVVHAIHIFCALVWTSGKHRATALDRVLYCITDHPWPRVRKITADQLYVHLLSSTDTASQTDDDICDLITTTSWISLLTETEEARQRLYAAFGVSPVPARIVVNEQVANFAASSDVDATYADLINDIARGLV